jgi:putative FmdB family regulatory protein
LALGWSECQHRGHPLLPLVVTPEDTVPTYQYACTEPECGHAFEQFQSFTDDALTVCPRCEGRLRKVFNAVGVVFKGSGFYRTDSRSNGTPAGTAPASSSDTGTGTGTGTGPSGDSGSTSGPASSSTGSSSSAATAGAGAA